MMVEIKNNRELPIDLLLLADPEIASINQYLTESSRSFVWQTSNEIRGVVVVKK